jgi:hypothetical protein
MTPYSSPYFYVYNLPFSYVSHVCPEDETVYPSETLVPVYQNDLYSHPEHKIYIVKYERFTWLIITGSGFDDWFIGSFFTSTINYNNSQLMTVWDSLHSVLDYEYLFFWTAGLVLIHESVTSSASVVRWLTLHSEHWTLLRMPNDWTFSRKNYDRTEQPSGEPNIDHHLQQFVYYTLPRQCVFGEPLTSSRLPRLFVAAGACITKPLPGNGHIRHNILVEASCTLSEILVHHIPSLYARPKTNTYQVLSCQTVGVQIRW